MESIRAPQYLYRYRSLDGDSFERTKKIICDSSMYFASPVSFNDPFDCRPTFVMDGTEKQIKQYFAGVYKRQAPHLDRTARRSALRKNFKLPNEAPNTPEALERFAGFIYENLSSKIGLLCLTEKHDDLLMWSHYASSHSGICLGFHKDAESFAVAQPVKYTVTRPVVNPITQGRDEILDLSLFTKAKHWEYEAEWRIVHYKDGPGIYRHPSADLHCIILGARILERNRQAVVEWVEAKNPRPILYQAHLSKKTFDLRILPLR